MSFWGVLIKSDRPYTLHHDPPPGGGEAPPRRLRISQATLEAPRLFVKSRSVVRCSVGEKPPIFICALTPRESTSCPLDLEFEESEDVVFSSVGPTGIYLAGYYLAPKPNPTTNNVNSHEDTQNIGSLVAEDTEDANIVLPSRDSDENQLKDGLLHANTLSSTTNLQEPLTTGGATKQASDKNVVPGDLNVHKSSCIGVNLHDPIISHGEQMKVLTGLLKDEMIVEEKDESAHGEIERCISAHGSYATDCQLESGGSDGKSTNDNCTLNNFQDIVDEVSKDQGYVSGSWTSDECLGASRISYETASPQVGIWDQKSKEISETQNEGEVGNTLTEEQTKCNLNDASEDKIPRSVGNSAVKDKVDENLPEINMLHAAEKRNKDFETNKKTERVTRIEKENQVKPHRSYKTNDDMQKQRLGNSEKLIKEKKRKRKKERVPDKEKEHLAISLNTLKTKDISENLSHQLVREESASFGKGHVKDLKGKKKVLPNSGNETSKIVVENANDNIIGRQDVTQPRINVKKECERFVHSLDKSVINLPDESLEIANMSKKTTEIKKRKKKKLAKAEDNEGEHQAVSCSNCATKNGSDHKRHGLAHQHLEETKTPYEVSDILQKEAPKEKGKQKDSRDKKKSSKLFGIETSKPKDNGFHNEDVAKSGITLKSGHGRLLNNLADQTQDIRPCKELQKSKKRRKIKEECQSGACEKSELARDNQIDDKNNSFVEEISTHVSKKRKRSKSKRGRAGTEEFNFSLKIWF